MTQFIVDVPIHHIVHNETLASSPDAVLWRSFVTLIVSYVIVVPTIIFNSREYLSYGSSCSSEDLLNCWSWYNIIRCVSRIISPSLSRTTPPPFSVTATVPIPLSSFVQYNFADRKNVFLRNPTAPRMHNKNKFQRIHKPVRSHSTEAFF